ncbi:MAG: hypothetical protein MJ145_01975 [Clostridia bacterium]|nr:hypothetical protein [Clostridia bacterium]
MILWAVLLIVTLAVPAVSLMTGRALGGNNIKITGIAAVIMALVSLIVMIIFFSAKAKTVAIAACAVTGVELIAFVVLLMIINMKEGRKAALAEYEKKKEDEQ